MADYRLFLLDERNRITHPAVEMQCGDDQEALEAVKQHEIKHAAETRMIGLTLRLDPLH